MCNGLILAAWVSRIPEITERIDLSSGDTGTAFMGIALGSITVFPFFGRIVTVRGSANMLTIAGLFLAAVMPFAPFAPNLWTLFLVLYLAGFGVGGTEVAMNTQGVEVERFGRKNIMSSLHGFYSVGAFVGAGFGALMAAVGVSPRIHIPAVCLFCAVVYITSRRWAIPDAPHDPSVKPPPAFAFPPRSLWLIGLVGIAVAVAEGGIADWGGLYLNDELHRSPGFAALAFTLFQLSMLTFRFFGDRLVARFGAVNVLRIGAIVATLGLVVGIGLHEAIPALIGFMLAGAGVAVAFPLVFSAAANKPGLAQAHSVAAISALAYSGFLMGPPILGWFAEATSLRVMFGVIAGLCALVIFIADAVKGAGVVTEEIPVNPD